MHTPVPRTRRQHFGDHESARIQAHAVSYMDVRQPLCSRSLLVDSVGPPPVYNRATSGGHTYGSRNFQVKTTRAVDSRREETMGDISGPLAYLLFSWGLITVALVILLIYRVTLSSKEDDQLYLNKAEVEMMGSDQAAVITRLNRLSKPILTLAILSGILLVASVSLWVWIGFNNP